MLHNLPVLEGMTWGAVMRKPSAALVVASAALVMATIGTSVAASGYTITSSKQIKAGSISLSDPQPGRQEGAAGRAKAGGSLGLDGADGVDGEPGADGEDGSRRDRSVGVYRCRRHRERVE